MILVLDAGNTQILLGVYDGEKLLADCRLTTERQRTADEYGLLLMDFFANKNLPANKVDAVVLASVVPPLTSALIEMARAYFHCEPLVVGPGIRTGLFIRYENPREVGADRVANAVAAVRLYGTPVIIVDFGTATTLCAVNAEAEYLGGIIAPGIGISAEALFHYAAKLPRVELQKPPQVIGKNPVTSIQSGLVYGYTDLVDGLIRRMIAEMDAGQPRVVATGGYCRIIAKESQMIQIVNPVLTLEGLRFIYHLNIKEE
ncbi:MAG: type III pantothenate kinase [Firmicutes bacterium]|nr:type III pantothenate kinase [Bacillota bacterium]